MPLFVVSHSIVTVCIDPGKRLSNSVRYGSESPSKYVALLSFTLPLTQSAPLLASHAVALSGLPFAHWSRVADGFAPVAAAGRKAKSAAVARTVSSQRPRLRPRFLASVSDLSSPR